MEELKDFIVPLEKDDKLKSLVARRLKWPLERIGLIRFLRRSVDARHSRKIQLVYHLEIYAAGEAPEPPPNVETIAREIAAWERPRGRAVVVGAGPAGLFAALTLRRQGWEVDLVERGSAIAVRRRKIGRYFSRGELDGDDNVCFGLGGAGMYSDGKLTTRIKHPEVKDVLTALVAFGAPEDILYAHAPHVGSDVIRRVIDAMAGHLARWGVRLRLNTRMTGLTIADGRVVGVEAVSTSDEKATRFAADAVLLGAGHGAGDVYALLRRLGVAMTPKPFAVGLRVQHPQAFVDRRQYGHFAGHPALETASYRLTASVERLERGVYSFCMCPGGYVAPAATDPDGIVVNGMSHRRRGSRWANSAVVATVDARDWGGDLFAPLDFRRGIERRAFDLARQAGATREVPAALLASFLHGARLPFPARTSCLSGAVEAD
ncbi:MAG: FAD-binding protein, partial [Myxococcales bacterium]